MWRLLAGYDNTLQLQNCSLQGLFPLNRSESKKQMSFQDSPALVGLRGGSPRRVSWYKAILLRWDGLHLTLHFQCTSVHCTCWNWTPLPAQCPSEMCHTLCYRVLASDTVAVREAEFTTLSGELARSSAAEQQCTKIHCTGKKTLHSTTLQWSALKHTAYYCLGGTWHCVSWAQGSCQKCRTGFYQRPRTNGENEALTHPSQVLQRRSVGESD